jgi:hypothetical protein
MFEFTAAYLKPFDWAKQAYDYMLGSVPNKKLDITKESLVSPTLPSLSSESVFISTDSDWNFNSKNQVALLGAMYQSIDQAEEYFNGLYTLVSSRIAESEKRIQEQDSNLRVLLSSSRNVATTAIHLKGGDSTSIETNEKYYRVFGPLEAVPNEGIFRLKDTGSFSSIRSLGGFGGQVEIDFTLGQIVSNGKLEAITDGTRNTFWSGVFYTPAPVRADQNDVAWLPSEYKHGYACMITYYMDRPTVATEVYVEPVTTEPMDLVSISWTPINLSTAIINGTYYTSGNGEWSYVAGASWNASSLGLGVASGACLVVGSSGWASQTFGVSGTYLTVSGTSLVNEGRRCQIHYSMRGAGDLVSGVRIVWLNVSGDVIDYKLKEDFPTGFFANHRLVDFVPVGAVSGRIDVGIFTPVVGASAYFDEVKVLMGERNFPCQEVIDRPKTISLPEIARSGRFSFTFSQRNPRREVLAKEAINISIPEISDNLYIDSTLQQATTNLANRLKSPGPGTSIFSYRLGMKELDLRYREHIPRGSIVSLPLYSRREIRNIWVTAEIGQFFNDNTKFYIYPFADNTELKDQIQPFGIGEVDSASTTLLRNGEILRIHTFEEQDAGWVNLLDKVFLTNPKTIKETFDGTDREGRVRLNYAPHLRRVWLKNIQDWLKAHSIWSTPFDPNLQIIYGLPESMQSTINAIRNNTASGYQLDDLISREGYIPLKVTVSTDKWTAVPDIYGRPDISKVRTALLEELTETTVVETTVEVQEDYMSYDAWLAATDLKTFSELRWGSWNLQNLRMNGFFGDYWTSYNEEALKPLTLKKLYEDLIVKNPIQAVPYKTFLKASYDMLKAQGKIPKSSNNTRTTTAAVEVDDVFSTRYKPIITGPNGTFIQLYWYDPTSVKYVPVSRSAYEVVKPEIGLIKILQAAPGSGFTSILADYKYISYTEVEDHFGSVITFAVAASTATGAIAASIGLTSKPFPITRNMTDYEDGRIPTLRAPNFDRLSKDYYPVIEYYVNSDGELIFARDFFRYGDIPARVSVEYQTLAVQPRVGVEITRSGSPAATPTINNVSLRVRESTPLPIRESS